MIRHLTTALLGLLLAIPAHAEIFAIVHATLHKGDGSAPLENATLLVRDGRIEALGAGLAAPEGYRVVDAAGRPVTPGIFAAFTTLGLVEVSAVADSRDSAVRKTPFHAAFDVRHAINPFASAIAVSRIEGITRAAVTPTKGDSIFAGQGALIHLGNGFEIVTKPGAFMVAYLDAAGASEAGGSRGGAALLLINALRDAARYAKAPDPNEWQGVISALDAEALAPVIAGHQKLLLHADRAIDLYRIVQLKEEMPKLDIVIVGAAEGWRVADRLARAKIPVIVHPFANLPDSFSDLAATQANPARLAAAGVKVAIADTSGDGHNARLVLQYAGNAVANGMRWADALAAITYNPAEIFGVGKDLGSLAPGKIADIVIWDGDPLELMSSPDAVFIAGEEQSLVSRQTELRDRYKDLGGDKPFAYRR